MKITMEKEAIVEGLQNAAIIIPTKAGTSYIKSIWLRAEENSLYVMSTDAGIEFTGKYRVQVHEPGLCGVQGRTFVDLIRQLPKGAIDLSVDEETDTLLVEQGRRHYKLALKNKEWFQEFNAFPEEDPITWAGGVLADCLDRISFCIGDGTNQEATRCLCFKPVENGNIEISGMDGHQFAMCTFNYADLADKLPEKGMLIEKHFLPSLRKWLTEDEIELNVTEKRVFFRRSDGVETLSVPHASGLIYPDYNTFLNKLKVEGLSELEVDRKELIDCLGRLQVFNTPADSGAIVELNPNEVIISAQGSDVGSAKENLEVKYSGTVDRICFPSKDLQEVVGHFASPMIHMRMVSNEGACEVTGADDLGYLVVLMPIRMANVNYYGDGNKAAAPANTGRDDEEGDEDMDDSEDFEE